MQAESRITVFFEAPFWVALYERRENGGLQACKITFGAEPNDATVYEFLLGHWDGLSFSPPVQAAAKTPAGKINPKRMQRAITKQLAATGGGTKAQQALQLQREQGKRERGVKSRAKKEAEKQRQFDLRRQKRKQKHKGH